MNRRHSSPQWTIVIAATCSCLVAAIQGQSDPPAPKTSNLVTVRGCLDGRVLTTTDESGIGDTSRRFDLTGDRQMTRLLKEQSGHMVEVTGMLRATNPNGPPLVKERAIGKGRVYIGAGKSTGPPADASVRPSIAVRELTRLAGRCSS